MEEEVKALLEQIESLKRCFPVHHEIADLQCLQRMGIVHNYERIREFSVAIVSHSLNITTVKGFEVFMESLTNKIFRLSENGSGADLLLSCVDNYKARMGLEREIYSIDSMRGFGISAFKGGEAISSVVDDNEVDTSSVSKSTVHIPDGLIHELPKADEFQKLLVFEETIDLSHQRIIFYFDKLWAMVKSSIREWDLVLAKVASIQVRDVTLCITE
ncbi:Ubiquitin-like modifier-activating enzyme 5 [Acorus calamus]|uniref:Ubiquitin-like modifier-activating enzyme 5 n=1 Tax=Acorus calamus TaxID=4465 RepID=A0AAV9E1P6_ACOCL|nr:Ubiquitin-like modifier-activating enzyme 5 [Acorus calamus]